MNTYYIRVFIRGISENALGLIIYIKNTMPYRYNVLMDEQDKRLYDAIENTWVVRPPTQALATFGVTSVKYYLITTPIYQELGIKSMVEEAVIREGIVRAERPQVVTPHYLMNHEGFGENAEKFLRNLIKEYGPDQPGLMYRYKNDGGDTSVVSGSVDEVTKRIVEKLDKENKPLEAVIRGPDDLWDVSLMKFIYELTARSAHLNANEMRSHGLLDMEANVPRDAHRRIDLMFVEAQKGNLEPKEIHKELQRWDLFDEYQDKFLQLFK